MENKLTWKNAVVIFFCVVAIIAITKNCQTPEKPRVIAENPAYSKKINACNLTEKDFQRFSYYRDLDYLEQDIVQRYIRFQSGLDRSSGKCKYVTIRSIIRANKY